MAPEEFQPTSDTVDATVGETQPAGDAAAVASPEQSADGPGAAIASDTAESVAAADASDTAADETAETPAPKKRARRATSSTPRKRATKAAKAQPKDTASDEAAAAPADASADTTSAPADGTPADTASSDEAPMELGEALEVLAEAMGDPAVLPDETNADNAAADAQTSDEGAANEADTDDEDSDDETEEQAVPVASSFGLLFQAPDLTAAPRRSRRATAPASAPAPAPEPAADEEPEDAPDQAAAQDADTEQAADDQSGKSRRRRGGKGRRSRSGSDDPTTEAAADTASDSETQGEPAQAADSDEADDAADASSRRTRRRRRRGSAGADDQDATVRVREPRRTTEATGIKGSTRLEAKKQRRREGREAGRRRTVITEAEFLARRESVERSMVVRRRDDRTQIAVLEDGVLVEHYVSRQTSDSSTSIAGNIYLGRVQNVLPSMEAAFVDIGKGRNAVLYAGEVNWDAAGLESGQPKRIENALSAGQTVLVQATKDPIGHKGARLTSQISLPGRYIVFVPDGNMTGISRKLPENERARLKRVLREVMPDKAGVIVRTAAEGASEEELRADVARLTGMWDEIQAAAKTKSTPVPSLVHGEPDLTIRVIRDVFNEDFASMVVSGDEDYATVSSYVGAVAPDLADRVSKWTGEKDVFAEHRIDEQLAKAMDRKVWLPSGGSLVIDRTEAMTVIDVNTGKFVGQGGNLEETVTKNNLEAAEEIVRQLRLRDIGGIVVVDFIDMVLESNRDLVLRRLVECLGRDRTKHQVAEVTSLGLVQMTRKRVGTGLVEAFSETCEHCNGRGIIIHSAPVSKSEDEGRNDGGDQGRRGRRNNRDGRDSGRDGGGRDSNRRGNNSGNGNGNGGSHGNGHGGANGSGQGNGNGNGNGGPTPAQIAAAAHAAALAASSSQGEPTEAASEAEVAAAIEAALGGAAGSDQATDADQGATADQGTTPEAAAVATDQRPAKKGRRRATRGSGSVDASPAPDSSAAQVMTLGESSAEQSVDAQPASTPQPPARDELPPSVRDELVNVEVEVEQPRGLTDSAGDAEPAARPRRRRGRVVAPAGPPRSAESGAGESGAGEEPAGEQG